ncbi:hypothetical protein DFH07DRAFT_145834 [Mycena maculata]|uniref:Uncharacterized protein n=1 Tax=Mycena maculata TaxID=230809 RepID=A0AAD7JXV3_9AGAR|nr:hypothetical protein DFH07DRAFT_145834 [Mycena maculata]
MECCVTSHPRLIIFSLLLASLCNIGPLSEILVKDDLFTPSTPDNATFCCSFFAFPLAYAALPRKTRPTLL